MIFAGMSLRILITVLSTWSYFILQAQPPMVLFHEPEAELGVIIDNQGVVAHKFNFSNKSAHPIAVDKVSTSCGCTSTNWTTEVIGPGSKGFVEVQLDPYNRPGPFEKFVTVFLKDHEDSIVLKIKGFVKPGTASVAEAFPIKMGNLRVIQNTLDLGTITKKALHSRSFEVYNEGDQILVFADDMEGPNHITVTFEPYTLKPKSKGKIWVHYDVKAKKDLGFFREDIAVFTYESQNSRKVFSVSATLLDLPEERSADAPRVYFNETELDFGIKKQGDTVNVKFDLQNQGRSSLMLKKVFGNCNCIRVNPEKYQVNPGETSSIDVMFLTNDRLGNQEKTVTVFTDDPLMPVAILKLKGRLRGPRN
jgi:hypothetical protein